MKRKKHERIGVVVQEMVGLYDVKKRMVMRMMIMMIKMIEINQFLELGLHLLPLKLELNQNQDQ